MRFIENYPIDQITPADYNPRKIKENAFEKLQESLLKFGVCKAVIANLSLYILTYPRGYIKQNTDRKKVGK